MKHIKIISRVIIIEAIACSTIEKAVIEADMFAKEYEVDVLLLFNDRQLNINRESVINDVINEYYKLINS